MKRLMIIILSAMMCALMLTGCGNEAGTQSENLPKKGEYLYQALNDEHLASIKEKLPVSITIVIDQGGDTREAVLTGKEEIQECVDLFTEIKIGGEGTSVTDNYNSVSFDFEDGTNVHVSLCLENLEVYDDGNWFYFELDEFDPFWRYAKNIVK